MIGRMWREVVYLVLLVGPLNLVRAEELELTMPNVQPQQNDLYLCIEKKIDDPISIIGFKPKASMTVAHHILIYGCSEPGSSGNPWNCGEMHSDSDSAEFKPAPVCKDGGRIIYAWAMDAPELKLPDDVAFKVGGDTAMKYLVMQVHYKDVTKFLPPSVEKDNSGVILTTTNTPREKTAGVYLVAANGRIAPKSVTYMEAACTFQEPVTLHPFAFRVHTHKLGKVVSGYRVRDGQWTEIGRRNPQKPQMFYPVQDTSLDIQKGDVIAARCTMKNDGQKAVATGSTSDDEMCNFYMMYYVSGNKDITDPVCVSPGPPVWNWKSFSGMQSEGFPFQASMDPETNAIFEETKQRLHAMERNMRAQGDEIRRQLDDVFNNLWKGSSFGSNAGFQNAGFPSDAFNNMYGNSYPSSNNYRYSQPGYGGQGYGNYDGWNAGSYNYYQEPQNENEPYRFTNVKVHDVPGSASQTSQRFRLKNGKFEPVGDATSGFGQVGSSLSGALPSQNRFSNVRAQEGPGFSSQTAQRFRLKNGRFEPVNDASSVQHASAPAAQNFDIPPINFNYEMPDFSVPSLQIDESIFKPSISEKEIKNMFDNIGSQGTGNSEFGSIGQGEGPVISEYFQSFDDKNGGKGFVQAQSSQENKKLNIPGGTGYDKSSSQSVRTSYSYSSP